MNPAILFAAIPLFAWADRTVGGAGRRSHAFGAVVALGLATGFLGHLWAVTGLSVAWVLYRSLPWKIGGSTTPHGGQIAASFARHAIPALAALILWRGGWGPMASFYAMILYAAAATALSVSYATAIDKLKAAGGSENGQINSKYELARGAFFGIALAMGFIVQV